MHEQFLTAIRANPDDDAPRLIYSDWLEEHGQEGRAEFCAVQCELERLFDRASNWPVRVDKNKQWGIGLRDRKLKSLWEQVDALRRRERELWGYLPDRDRILEQFAVALPDFAVILPNDTGVCLQAFPQAVVRRGFIDSITCTYKDWAQHSDAVLTSHPVTRVKLTTMPTEYPATAQTDVRHIRLVSEDGALLNEFRHDNRSSFRYFGPLDSVHRELITHDGVMRCACRGRWPLVKHWELPPMNLISPSWHTQSVDIPASLRRLREQMMPEPRLTPAPDDPGTTDNT